LIHPEVRRPTFENVATRDTNIVSLDATTIQKWRSETLKALAATPEIETQTLQVAKKLANAIVGRLTLIFPIINNEQHGSLVRFYEKVILPSVKLATAIQTSSNRYIFSPRPSDRLELGWRKVGMEALEDVKMIDVKTRRTLKMNSPIVADRDGYIGKPLLQVEPELVRLTRTKETNILLRRSTFLIELCNPLEQRR